MRRIKVVYVPLEQIEPNPWNPQVETDQEFQLLVESVRETDGLVEAILVRPLEGVDLSAVKMEDGVWVYRGPGRFQIIHGEHRYKALQALGASEAPCVVIEADDEFAKFLSVRLNQLHGKFDPQRLWALIQSFGKSYRMEYLARKFGFTSEDALRKLVKKVAEQLPESVRFKYAKAMKEVESIQALSDIIHRIFNEHGNQLEFSYMIFEWGGHNHIWVRMSEEMARYMFAFVDRCAEENRDVAQAIFEAVLAKYGDVKAEESSGVKKGAKRK
ncbi:MAG: ParB/RepB/Spo0J family partition protein [Candidatus Micrarchaeaceae archaeon]